MTSGYNMKILIAALDETYNFTVPLLEADGHEVRLLTRCEGIPLLFGTPEGKAYVLQQITEFEPDLVINAVPSIVLSTSSDYTYVGNNWVSARLETHKWETSWLRINDTPTNHAFSNLLEAYAFQASSHWNTQF